MHPRRKILWAKAAILLAVPILLWAYSYGPNPGYVDVPGELGDCASCHLGTAVNSAGGSVAVNFPNGLTYTPGVAQHLAVTIADPVQHAWGFELTARQASSASTMAGSFTSGDANTQLQCSQPNLQIFEPVAYGASQVCPAGFSLAYIEHSATGYNATRGQTGSATYQFEWTPPASSVGSVVIYVAGNAANGDGTSSGDHIYTASYTLSPSGTSFTNTYDFAHLALGNGFQTTLTYVNYSPQTVTCQTSFYSDSGAPLPVPFAGAAASARTDTLSPGGSLHQESQFNVAAPLEQGWAQAQCTGPVQASLLYRLYNSQGAAQGEASVIATAPATEFVTFAQTQTGIAYANPSNQTATVTINVLDGNGSLLGSTAATLAPNAHGSANLGPLLHLAGFTGSVQIVSTVPIVALSLNAEAFPVFSSLPPGGLPDGTPLAAGH